MSWTAVGLDGGLKGAVVAINESLDIVEWFDMPTITEKKGKGQKSHFNHATLWLRLESLVERSEKIMLFLEKAQARTGQGVTSMFSTGLCFGMLQMALTALNRPFLIVPPTEWTRKIYKGMGGKDTKAKSILQCSKLFPKLPIIGPRGGKFDGRSDAALIAYYGLTEHVPNRGAGDGLG